MLFTIRNLRSRIGHQGFKRFVTDRENIRFLLPFHSFEKNGFRPIVSSSWMKRVEETGHIKDRHFSSHTGWEGVSEKKKAERELSDDDSTLSKINDFDEGGAEYNKTKEENAKEFNQDENMYHDPRNEVLEESLTLVPQFGWSDDTLAAGARSCGYPSVSHGMFSRGAIELVEYFVRECNSQLRIELEALKSQGLDNVIDDISSETSEDDYTSLSYKNMTEKERLKKGIQARLLMINPYLNSWPQALALGLQPQNIESTFRMIIESSTDIAYFADYKNLPKHEDEGKNVNKYDTDMEWYTYRASIAAIYISTDIFMLTDYSDNFKDTWDFLDQRLEEFASLRKQGSSLDTFVKKNPVYTAVSNTLGSSRNSDGKTETLSDSIYAISKATSSLASGAMSLVQPVLYQAIQGLPVKGKAVETLHTFVNDLTPPPGIHPLSHLQGKVQRDIKNGLDRVASASKQGFPSQSFIPFPNMENVPSSLSKTMKDFEGVLPKSPFPFPPTGSSVEGAKIDHDNKTIESAHQESLDMTSQSNEKYSKVYGIHLQETSQERSNKGEAKTTSFSKPLETL